MDYQNEWNESDSEIKKVKRRVFYTIIGLVIIIVVGIGVKVYMDERKFNEEMIKVVNSKEAKKVYEQTIKNRDALAFTKEGIIQSYKIDYDSVKHNPMGGIMFVLIINNDDDLYIHVTLAKLSDGTLENSSGGYSSKLDELLIEEELK